jgi:hypothetical protein
MTQEAICGSVRYRGAEATVPATCHASFFELHLQNLHVEMTKRYELMAHETADVKEFWEIFDCPSYTSTVI